MCQSLPGLAACLIRDRRFGRQGSHRAVAIGRLLLIARSQEPKPDAISHQIELLDQIDTFALLHTFSKPVTVLYTSNVFSLFRVVLLPDGNPLGIVGGKPVPGRTRAPGAFYAQVAYEPTHLCHCANNGGAWPLVSVHVGVNLLQPVTMPLSTPSSLPVSL